jgi:hypothetical protein
VVQGPQIDRILQSLSADLEKAAAEGTADALTGRMGGAALVMAQAQYAAKAASPDEKLAFELGTTFADRQIVARSQVWPRSFVVATDAAETEAPFIYQIEQADARSPYKVVLWARLLAGATIPATSVTGVGSDVVDPGSEDLLATPIAAVQAYAAAKDNSGGEEAKLFDTAPVDGVDPDPVRARWGALIESFRGGVTAHPGGALTSSSILVEGSVSALATSDFGALVFGQVKSVVEMSFTPDEGRLVNIQRQGYKGLGAATLEMSQSARVEHLQTVVLAVPPEGADGPIRVIAVADLPTVVEVK